MKYWEELLTAWKTKGRTGLSIPFIIGSQHYLPNALVHQDIKQLFVDIATADGIQVYLTYCYIINDFILGELGNSNALGKGFFLSFQNTSQDKLYVSDFLDLGMDVESISSQLVERLEHCIQQGQYSINDGERGNYKASEVAFINDSFSRTRQVS